MNNYTGKSKHIYSYSQNFGKRASSLDVPFMISEVGKQDFLSNGQLRAIWDTGASTTAISKELAQKLNLPVVQMRKINTAAGTTFASVHYVSLVLPNNVVFNKLLVTACDLVPPLEALIGMDVISQGDFSVSNFNNCTRVSFRMPSLADIDYVVWAKNLDTSIPNGKKTGRNDPCPCGSGKRYKNCCIT